MSERLHKRHQFTAPQAVYMVLVCVLVTVVSVGCSSHTRDTGVCYFARGNEIESGRVQFTTNWPLTSFVPVWRSRFEIYMDGHSKGLSPVDIGELADFVPRSNREQVWLIGVDPIELATGPMIYPFDPDAMPYSQPVPGAFVLPAEERSQFQKNYHQMHSLMSTHGFYLIGDYLPKSFEFTELFRFDGDAGDPKAVDRSSLNAWDLLYSRAGHSD